MGQQIGGVPAGPTQGAAPLAQTHLPSWQTMPSGQQNWLGAVGEPQVRSLGQHRPPRQVAPLGQQIGGVPAGPTQGAFPLGQTHLPSWQTMPSGQQKRPVDDLQTWFAPQHRPATQVVPWGQQIARLEPGTVHAVVPSWQTHLPLRQTMPSGQQNARLVPRVLQTRAS